MDVNDRAPEFQPSNSYHARISEAAQPGTEVKQVIAIEYDKHAENIKYYLENTGPGSDAFEITEENRESGVITLRTQVDREVQEEITLSVRAEDAGVNPLSNFAQVQITVEDVNDNRSVLGLSCSFYVLAIITMKCPINPLGAKT